MPQLTVLPDYHFLLIAPNLGAEWLFDAARSYWDRFRPTVISDLELASLIPPQRLIVITVVARRDAISQIGVDISQRMPMAIFDPVVEDTFDNMRNTLNQRAFANQPFGAPMATLPPTLDPNQPIIPTPRVPTSRPPAGFITATPSPDVNAVPTQPPNLTPVQPTPGPVTGG